MLYIRGMSKTFVHWRYSFLTTKDVKMIFGDLLIILCISSFNRLNVLACCMYVLQIYMPFNMATLGTLKGKAI